ncbi:hypothetical protein FRB98_001660 [Tulasnella sp. 332]|nr:hypothetical protein FRB98_001660 [Tulasnella sp. 332]
MDKARLKFKHKNGPWLLQHGSFIKVAIKFAKAWWKDLRIKGGQSYGGRCIRTVVYPSYPTAKESSTVLIASYYWAHDAVRIGTLINVGEEAELRLKKLVFEGSRRDS